ncbi:MAG: leucine-rich repeat protein [Lachnospiraceae bacterium]|nr:leucine-rich repeat protein [Lachnospiraceae bacterium]
MRIVKKGISAIVMACMLLCMAPSGAVHAVETTDPGGFTVEEETGALTAYNGPGGDITIPDNVRSINAGVFASEYGKKITSVTIPASVSSMGVGAFYDCTSLTSVTILGDLGAIPAEAFYNCTSLANVSINAPVTSIGSQAFAKCGSLSSFSIPGTVSKIDGRAFEDCTSLTAITIPASVSSLSGNAFDGCSSLKTIDVASGNGAYASADGCLYDRTMTKLIRCPEGKSNVTISGGTTTIGSGAFAYCYALTSLSLPESVTTIQDNAFSGSGIETILIPGSVTAIGGQSNWKPSEISGYAGTQAQTYASSAGIAFQSLGGTASPTVPDNGSNGSAPSDNGDTSASTDPGTTPPPVADNGSSGATVDSNPTSGGNVKGNSNSGTAASNAHEKDATPKTGDGINPVFFLCFAILLVGVYFVVAKREKTVEQE